MEQVDCIVAGAGVIGLAVARTMAAQGLDTLILEAADAIGTETSSRNSEVIHAGIYYPRGSLKARYCVDGRELLYRYCAERSIPHRRCGKLIVATDEAQEPVLASIRANAAACGVDDLRFLSAAEAQTLEPALHCTKALLSPSTGIIDSHALMLALLGEAEENGAMLSLNTRIVSGRIGAGGGIVLETMDSASGERFEIAASHLINAAGLGAVALAASLDGFDRQFLPTLRYAKGNYFSVAGRAPFSRLVYPVPEPGGLGVHLTLDLAGTARFGPDVEWTDRLDYRVDPARGERFYDAIRKYWPELADGSLQAAYSGIRPKLSGPGEANSDFVIQDPATHRIEGLVNLFGIESPGLTSSLAIAEHVARILGPRAR
ncbi:MULTISPECIES: NAD(P)/FAD-dependent oxidoreductase [Mesorhizobium]|uniref:NAD(P)/FAD-dependent oxidoreductase n=4 Tax=Mesorhizobium TaxID=68287 RepID=A0ABU5AP23_9HYPH|nr:MULTISPECIES: NAD(P)/FAD-dependent oxidoreductase [Mesorhizobium]RVC58608.1 NAD(P)/FAD-dependent oxidoreductase [Mesorhizobium sp. M4B.F.Ca.ET.088.02.2.1]MDX8436161.1 NAD(P)/FAD-dependent oxidoreductase [Mesorhizobium abyssinicae]MDX8539025.1 NAD(P)/FAD-dependent oxidoreductase [Mesorhizobium abyssinicae]RUW70720.1 NAD(P)/FAD-dependent oxidoreductase [Mesorhizobium sp. M4B.F.Ca.ET.049.02.1.2]RVD26615.1 NAD(P)/FAD-dependent oxidoreductase [Mesorhizobium sp. M4B.F.Ca.ET.017.02.2.1]